MENFVEIYKQHLTIETGKLLEISEKLIPLQKEKIYRMVDIITSRE